MVAVPEARAADPRFSTWLITVIVAITAMVLTDVSRLIGDVQVDGEPAYDASVYTNAHPAAATTEELSDAIHVWQKAQRKWKDCTGSDCGPSIAHLLKWHICTDFLFTVVYCLLLFRILKHLNAGQLGAWLLTTGLFLVDEVENVLSLRLIGGLSATHFDLVILQSCTDLKWLFLIGIILTALKALWQHWRVIPPARPLASVLLIVCIWVALIAFPAGGPLEQLPDVVRAATESHTIYESLTAVLLFALSVRLAASWCLTPPSDVRVVLNRRFFLVTATVSLFLTLLAQSGGHSATFALLAPVIVYVAMWVFSLFFGQVMGDADVAPPLMNAAQVDASRPWASALCGIVILAGGLALFRAAFPPWVVGTEGAGLRVAMSVIVAVAGAVIARYPLSPSPLPGQLSRSFKALVVALTCTTAALVAFSPVFSSDIGSLGVVSISLGFLALSFGALRWLSYRSDCQVLQPLGLNRRFSWLTFLAVCWCLSSAMNTKGYYHDVRVFAASPEASAQPHTSLKDAFDKWQALQTRCVGSTTRVIPLVMVAAAGGGIRAGYWTAEALDQLFKGTDASQAEVECIRSRLFAVSSVSGGSIGAATYIAAVPSNNVTLQISKLAEDRALAAALSGLLLRDLVQPFIGWRWPDRATLLEDAWERETVFADAPNHFWGRLRSGAQWTPVLVMNSSSVLDGCRILVANVGGLAANQSGDCSARAEPGQASPPGPVSGAVDPFIGLASREHQRYPPCNGNLAAATRRIMDMRTTTAMLLSARFPYVTPTGALIRCVERRQSGDDSDHQEKLDEDDTYRTMYAVDGGYYENSGIFTLIQMWSALAPLVATYNADKQHPTKIAPWMVVLDNAYRAEGNAEAHNRPQELFAPLRAQRNNNQLIDQRPLEQMASASLHQAIDDSADGSVATDCVVVLTPRRRPSVAAPLGWVLSKLSQSDLDGQLTTQLAKQDAQELLRQIRGSEESLGECQWRVESGAPGS